MVCVIGEADIIIIFFYPCEKKMRTLINIAHIFFIGFVRGDNLLSYICNGKKQ